MEVIYSKEKQISIKASILTVGSYDGIHLGHRKLLSTLVQKSKDYEIPSIVVTFDPHPREILNEKFNNFPLIMNLDQKLKIIESCGVDIAYVINFTEDYSKITANDFMHKTIIPFFNPKIIIIGSNHYFGKGRKGSPSYLKNFGKNNLIQIIIIQPVLNKNEEISSSRIREFVTSGFIKKANYELGTKFSIQGEVVHGAGRGHSLNFPTANINPLDKRQLLPKIGVYLIHGRINGLNTFGMCNLGLRPTFSEKKLVMEIHFFHDQIDNLYGKKVKVEFLERIRDEKKFPTSKDLIKQLNIDKQTCLEISNKYK